MAHLTMQEKDPNDPSTTSFQWDHMIDTWAMIETLLGGTAAMRAAGPVYLPQHAEESDDNYNERITTNILFNALEITLNHMVGRPFSDPVRLNQDVPELIANQMANVDLQGNDITTFCRQWFREGLAKGFAHVLVDMPATSVEIDDRPQTLADDRASGRRPFWQLIAPENMIFAEAAVEMDPVSGELRERYTHVRLREDVVERQGFAQVVRERIRVIEPNFFQVWEKISSKKRKPEWRIIEEGETGIDFVPIVTFYAQRESFLESKPPFEDLSFLNIRHWQSMSDQINILTVIRFPMLAVSGATDQTGSTMRIGPRQLLGTKDPNGKFYYVEHNGNSIESGERELENLEESMEAYGSTLLKKKAGNETATKSALSSAESVTPLQDMTVRFIDSVNNVLALHAHWLKVREGGGTVKINTDFVNEEIDKELSKLLMELRKGRDISRLAAIREAKKLGVLSVDYNAEDDLEQIKKEDKDLKPFQPQVPGTFDPKADSGNANPPPADDSEEGPARASEE